LVRTPSMKTDPPLDEDGPASIVELGPALLR
jgi:hypothetical protein